jgi:hypothetical protein
MLQPSGSPDSDLFYDCVTPVTVRVLARSSCSQRQRPAGKNFVAANILACKLRQRAPAEPADVVSSHAVLAALPPVVPEFSLGEDLFSLPTRDVGDSASAASSSPDVLNVSLASAVLNSVQQSRGSRQRSSRSPVRVLASTPSVDQLPREPSPPTPSVPAAVDAPPSAPPARKRVQQHRHLAAAPPPAFTPVFVRNMRELLRACAADLDSVDFAGFTRFRGRNTPPACLVPLGAAVSLLCRRADAPASPAGARAQRPASFPPVCVGHEACFADALTLLCEPGLRGTLAGADPRWFGATEYRQLRWHNTEARKWNQYSCIPELVTLHKYIMSFIKVCAYYLQHAPFQRASKLLSDG